MTCTRYPVTVLPPPLIGGSHVTVNEVASVVTEILGEPGAPI